MKPLTSIEDLLRWRAVAAENEAPLPPRAAQLLETTRPWWETWPERFRDLADRVGAMQVAYGHAMTEPQRVGQGYPVAALVVADDDHGETEVVARILYLTVRDGRIRLRFHLDLEPAQRQSEFDATLVAEGGAQALFEALASRSMDNEYRIDCDLSPELERKWEQLRVTDRMPFRLILRRHGASRTDDSRSDS